MAVILLLEPFYAGSHKNWADNLKAHSSHEIILLTLPGRHWKWRMASGAIDLAEKVNATNVHPDSMLVSSIIDLGLFKSLLDNRFQSVPLILYMHENQLTYPWNTKDSISRERQYAWINFTSILVADRVIFNSHYHMKAVKHALPEFFQAFPEDVYRKKKDHILRKFDVLTPGINGNELKNAPSIKGVIKRLLWSHRWEHDKNPELFFETLFQLQEDGHDFELVVCGEQYSNHPKIFDKAKKVLNDKSVHWGFFESRAEYVNMVGTCHILPVTSNQEFFGLSVMEAVFCGVEPLLPKRLSYQSLYEGLDVFYDEGKLYERLKESLVTSRKFELPALFDQYYWSNLIEEYDDLLGS